MLNIDFTQINIETFIEATCASAYLKDKNGTYLRVNSAFIKACNETNYNDVIGKKDKDLLWKNEADYMEQNDSEVIYTNCSKTIIEPCKAFDDGKIRSFLSHKIPLKNTVGKTIGVFGLSILMDNLYPLDNANDPTLTKRQSDCLLYLVQGLSLKQIGKKLKLSPRTVEHYLDAVKFKLNCGSRAELISKALKLQCFQKTLFFNKIISDPKPEY